MFKHFYSSVHNFWNGLLCQAKAIIEQEHLNSNQVMTWVAAQDGEHKMNGFGYGVA